MEEQSNSFLEQITGGLIDDVTMTTIIKPHVADAYFDKTIRIAALCIEIGLGGVGGACVFIWLWYNRRRKSRINALICNVAVSDMLVICYASAMQVCIEIINTLVNQMLIYS